jgi:hypothetical protein
MDRTSGTYKRWIHRLTFWAGFAVAIAFNVNSLQLIDNLWRDPVARAGLVAQASQSAQSADDVRGVQARLSAPAPAPSAAEGEAAAPDGEGIPPDAEGAEAPAPECACDGQNAADLAQDLPMPIGWSQEGLCALVHEPLSSLPPSKRPSSVCAAPYRSGWSATVKMFLTLLGLAITGLAVSLGAPFWFGILQSVTNIRSTGVKPDRSDGTAQR